MARVKRAVNAQKKRRTILESASGYRGQRSRLYRKAKEQMLHSMQYAYRDRRDRKGDFRQLWITRINAAARANGMTYNRLIQGLKLAGYRGRPQDPRRAGRQRRGGLRRSGRRGARGCRGARQPDERWLTGIQTTRVASGPRPGAEPVYTPRTPRVVAARQLLAAGTATRPAVSRRGTAGGRRGPGGRRRGRAVRDREGPAATRDLVGAAEPPASPRVPGHRRGPGRCWPRRSTRRALVAVCRQRDVSLPTWSLMSGRRPPALVAVLADIRDPGNAGTVLRTADAAGAQAVIFAGDTVDPYNGKCVRASAGSLFHVDVVRARDAGAVSPALRAAGLRVLAADLRDAEDLDESSRPGASGRRPPPGCSDPRRTACRTTLAAAADPRVRVPIHGRAESLNLAAAAAVCLYASARAHRSPIPSGGRQS